MALRKTDRTRHCLALAFLAVLLARQAESASSPVPLTLDQAVEEAGLYQSWLFSDLDGDKRPDLALGRSAAGGYTIEIRYSNSPETALLVLGRGVAFVRCVQFDVDRDNDQDLLVSSIGVLEYRSVWVNDGQGHFFRSERSANVYLPASGLTSTLELKYDPVDLAILDPTDRLPIDRIHRNCVCPISGSRLSAAVDPQGPILKPARGKHFTRGPPLT